MFKKDRATKFATLSIVFGSVVGLSLLLPGWRIVVVAATLIVATLGYVLLARCSGSSLRVNILPNISFLFVVYELLFLC